MSTPGTATTKLASVSGAAVTRLKQTPGGGLALRIAGDMARSEIADRAMTLAAQAFTSILPVMILLSAIPGKGLVDNALEHFDLSSGQLALTSDGTADPSVPFGVIGALMTIISATSFSRALDRVYSRVWEVPKLKLREGWRWIVVILAVTAGVILQGTVPSLRDVDAIGPAIGFGLQLVSGFTLWTLLWIGIAHVLTAGRLRSRALILNGMLTGAGLTILVVASHLAMSRVLSSATGQFGTLGIIFTVISWLFVFSAIVIGSTVIVHALAVDDGPIGGWLRAPGITAMRADPMEDSASQSDHEAGRGGPS